MSEANIIDIKPQEGFQTKVVASKADITIIGGAAGCGKSFVMLFIPLMYKEDKNLRTVYFRRTKAQIRQSGALWDESTKLYPYFNFEASESTLKWRLPKGGIIDFEGIEYEKDLINFQGAQIPLMLFDELTQFTQKQFFFMVSRNRGVITPGVSGMLQKGQIFASCNPDPDSWVANLIEWYIDQETGYPIPEREGKIRYFIVEKERAIFGDTAKQLYDEHPDYFTDPQFVKSGMHPRDLIKSFTFIGGRIYENKELLSTQPGYLASLMSQSDADKERFLKGNWKVRADDTGIYNNQAIENMFDFDEYQDRTYLDYYNKDKPVYGVDHDYSNKFIVCDAAKFGRDLCVITVWYKWTIIHTTIFHLSDTNDICSEIEGLMKQFHCLRKNVLVDQDGIGGDVVKLGKYQGFIARKSPAKDETTKEPENYVMRKDQCYFRSANRINSGETKWILLDATCKIYDRGSKNPRYSTRIKWNGAMVEVKSLIIKQLRAIKRGNVEFEGGVNMYKGGELKLCVNSKDEQKEILGHSPDFADCVMMREDFELRNRRQGSFKIY